MADPVWEITWLESGQARPGAPSRGRHTALRVVLTAAQRAELEHWQRRRAIAAGIARRGRLVLLVADGLPIAVVARLVGINRRFVYVWVRRFLADGVAGLDDRPRPGRVRR